MQTPGAVANTNVGQLYASTQRHAAVVLTIVAVTGYLMFAFNQAGAIRLPRMTREYVVDAAMGEQPETGKTVLPRPERSVADWQAALDRRPATAGTA